MEELDLKELLNMFWMRRTHVVLIVLIFVMVGVFYSLFMITPEYKASTTLVLARVEEGSSANASITQTEVSLNRNLITTYSELIKSRAVLGQVVENLSLLDIKEEELKKNISVTAVKNTELIQISVTHENSSYVDEIANEIAKVFSEKVEEIYSINNVQIVDEAEKTTIPYNVNHIRDIAISIAIGMILSVLYVIVANMIDNTVKTAEDIEKNTGLLVLATIPKHDFGTSNKGGNK